MKHPIKIEYLKGFENIIAEIFSRFTCHAVDQIVHTDLTCGIPTYASQIDDADRLELRTHWRNEQRADATISRVAQNIVGKT